MERTRKGQRRIGPSSLNGVLDVVGGIHTWMDASYCGSRNAAATLADVRGRIIEWDDDSVPAEVDPELPVWEDRRKIRRSR